METARATQILLNARAVQLISHDLANQTPQWAVAKRARPWIIGAQALCLLLAGYLVSKREFGEIGLRATSPDLRLKPVPMAHDLGATRQRWLDLTDKVVGAAPFRPDHNCLARA